MPFTPNPHFNSPANIRRLIVSELRTHFETQKSRGQEPDPSFNERVERWFGDGEEDLHFANATEVDPPEQLEEDLDVGAQHTQDHLPLSPINLGEPDLSIVDAPHRTAQEILEGIQGYDNNESEHPKLPSYRDYVAQSPAYQWLLSRIQRDIAVTVPTPNLMDLISETISKGLSRSDRGRVLSRSGGPHIFTVDLTARWQPLMFLNDQGYFQAVNDPGEALGKVITLTGTTTDAQALTAEQYIQQTWPLTGMEIFEALKCAVRRNIDGEFSSDTRESTTP